MDISWLLFKFDGRINCAKYWLATLSVLVAMVIAVLALASIGTTYGLGNGRYVINIIGISASVSVVREPAGSAASWFPQIATIPLSLAFAFIYAAVSIKRLHDRNKSGWWMLPFVGAAGLYAHSGDILGVADPVVGIVTAVLFLWGFIEMAFLKGMTGYNRFGPDPLAPRQDRPYRNPPPTPATYPAGGKSSELRVDYIFKTRP
jgi:uncharacterized membrane protein YhaH (DUF805 family)